MNFSLLHIFKKNTLKTILACVLGVGSLLLAGSALGIAAAEVVLPQSPSVKHGGVNISSKSGAVSITQSTDKGIINWQSFSIGPGGSVGFVHKTGRDAVTLNRVIGSEYGIPESVIEGALKADGNIFILNPSGILIGPGAEVNVGSLVVTTLGLSNDKFISGDYSFNNADVVGVGSSKFSGKVINRGKINVSDGGLAALVAPHVENHGVIIARVGHILLAAGGSVKAMKTVSFDDGLINFDVGGSGSIELGATSILDAGALITVEQMDDVVDKSINVGEDEARALYKDGAGNIVIHAGDNSGSVKLAGTINTLPRVEVEKEAIAVKKTVIEEDKVLVAKERNVQNEIISLSENGNSQEQQEGLVENTEGDIRDARSERRITEPGTTDVASLEESAVEGTAVIAIQDTLTDRVLGDRRSTSRQATVVKPTEKVEVSEKVETAEKIDDTRVETGVDDFRSSTSVREAVATPRVAEKPKAVAEPQEVGELLVGDYGSVKVSSTIAGYKFDEGLDVTTGRFIFPQQQLSLLATARVAPLIKPTVVPVLKTETKGVFLVPAVVELFVDKDGVIDKTEVEDIVVKIDTDIDVDRVVTIFNEIISRQEIPVGVVDVKACDQADSNCVKIQDFEE